MTTMLRTVLGFKTAENDEEEQSEQRQRRRLLLRGRRNNNEGETDPEAPPAINNDASYGATTNNNDGKRELMLSSSQDGSSLSHEHEPHLGASRQYWRDIILGVNDGLVSTFLLVAGVAGGGLSSSDILLTAIAGAIAGAVSMCAGEYVATKSQNEVLRGEICLERRHIQHFREYELEELRSQLMPIIGISWKEQRDLADQMVEFYKHNDEALLKAMTALEFGVLDNEERSPVKAGLFSCVLYTTGALPSILPFIFLKPLPGLVAAAIATTMALLAVGLIKTWATRGSPTAAAVENLVIAGFGGGFAYLVGVLFDTLVHS